MNYTNESDYRVDVITLSEIIEIYKNEKITFVKIDIEGGEENILEDLFLLGDQNEWRVFISFHLSWWNNPDIARFEHLLPLIKKSFISAGTDGLSTEPQEILPTSFFNYVRTFPFGSFYLEF